MKTLLLCPLWGSADMDFSEFVRKVKAAGYDGVELSFATLDEAQNRKRIEQLLENDLAWVGQHWHTVDTNLETHKATYRKHLESLAVHKPLFINSQSGKDFFNMEQNLEVLSVADEVAAETGVKIVHETHRGKFSFAAHITKEFLQAKPDLRITADFSHWVNVAETMLHDQQEALNVGIAHADHIHARVGFPEGPQIPDPRAAEWKETLDTFIGWWDKIIDRARGEGREYFTIASEFGPEPYMQIMPNSQEPIASQWDINVYMKDILQKRYNQ